MRLLRQCLCITGWLLIGSVLNAEMLTSQQLSKQLSVNNATKRVEALLRLDETDFLSTTQQLMSQQNMPDSLREYMLHQASLRLGDLSQNDARLEVVRMLQGYESVVHVQHLDGGHQQNILAYPVAANARAIESAWRLENRWDGFNPPHGFQATHFLTALSADKSRAGDELLSLALNRLSNDQAVLLSDEISATNPNLGNEHLVRIARAASDERLLVKGIQQLQLSPQDKVRPLYLTDLKQIWRGEPLYRVLTEMLDRQVHQNLALQQLAQLENLPKQFRARLVDLLADKNYGGDAAYVVAKHIDQDFLSALQPVLYGKNHVAQRRALLALKLADNDLGRDVLTTFFNKHSDERLKEEVMP